MDLNDYTALLRRVETLKSEKDRAHGAVDQLTKQLKSEYDCATTADAEKLLTKLQKENKAAEKEFAKAFAEFETEYGNLLND